ncbi:hypothetical protein B0O80DRAFT_499789 [Mortierella sp. GBAus27b]|nr:hypothetical protein BGX31_003270 [Mortierella sp. GBA43]KAI8351872.1 hypothetical protein B0O80DRAFT_499789 [Mortierella sp. GBAus27b]
MRFIHSLLVLCSVAAVVVQGKADGVTAGTIFGGQDSSYKGVKGAEVFRYPQNHVTAVSSILVHYAKKGGFRPKKSGIRATSQEYGRFFGGVLSFKGFNHIYRDEKALELKGGSEQFREAVTENYRSGPSKGNFAALVFDDQIPDNLDEQSQKYLLTLLAVRGEEDYREPVTLDLSSILAKLEKTGSGVEPTAQSTALRQLTLQVDQGFLREYAERLAHEIDIVSIDEALEYFTSSYPEFAPETYEAAPCRQHLYPLDQFNF